MTVTLDNGTIEQIAQRVADLLRGESMTGELVDAAEIARRFNVSRTTAYSKADEWGAIPIGDGARPRLRFDPEVVRERMGAEKPRTQPRRSSVRTMAGRGAGRAPLLPIRGSG